MAEDMTPEMQAAALEGFFENPRAIGYTEGYAAGMRHRDQQIAAILQEVKVEIVDPGPQEADAPAALMAILHGLRKIVGSSG